MSAGSNAPAASSTRPYRSARRQDQARRTRRRICHAARGEFLADGYAGTTIAAIAARAEVSGATVEKVFGTKANLLKEVIDVAIAGDDEPVPVLARTPVAEADAARTVEEFLHLVAGILAAGQQRSARLVLVALEAAGADPGLRTLARQRLEQRRSTAGWIVRGVAERTGLRPDIDEPYATEVVWLQMEPTLYCRLTEVSGWSTEQYRLWFADSVLRLLTDRVPVARG